MTSCTCDRVAFSPDLAWCCTLELSTDCPVFRRDYTLPELRAKLGDASGMWLWEIVRGLDYTEGTS